MVSAPRSRPLTTTSHAILGLLAVRDWTPYELTQQMRHGLGRYWPRAASKIYEEPRRLVALGLATAVPGTVGRRARTVYGITERGRAVLDAWLDTAPADPAFECEPLLRAFLAPYGSRAALLRSLDTALRWAQERQAEDRETAAAYLGGTGRFPERLAANTLVGAFLSDFALMTQRWARWALAEVEQWPDDVSAAQPDREALARIAVGEVAARP